jgi:hypothetical protein
MLKVVPRPPARTAAIMEIGDKFKTVIAAGHDVDVPDVACGNCAAVSRYADPQGSTRQHFPHL